jgi:hypothetical protein
VCTTIFFKLHLSTRTRPLESEKSTKASCSPGDGEGVRLLKDVAFYGTFQVVPLLAQRSLVACAECCISFLQMLLCREKELAAVKINPSDLDVIVNELEVRPWVWLLSFVQFISGFLAMWPFV